MTGFLLYPLNHSSLTQADKTWIGKSSTGQPGKITGQGCHPTEQKKTQTLTDCKAIFIDLAGLLLWTIIKKNKDGSDNFKTICLVYMKSHNKIVFGNRK